MNRQTQIQYWYNVWSEHSNIEFPKGVKQEVIDQSKWLTKDAKNVIIDESKFCMELENCGLKKTLVYKLCKDKNIFKKED